MTTENTPSSDDNFNAVVNAECIHSEQQNVADLEPAPAHTFGPKASRLLAADLSRRRPSPNCNTAILGSKEGSLAQMLRYEAPAITVVHPDPHVLRVYENDVWFSPETVQAAERVGRKLEVKRAIIGRAVPSYLELRCASPTSTGLKGGTFGLVIIEQAHKADLPLVIAEAKRLLQPGGRLVLMGYMPLRVEPNDAADRDTADQISRTILRFITADLKPFRSAGEQHLFTGFKNVDPSLQEVICIDPRSEFEMVADWNRDELLKHMLDWPSVANMHASGQILGFGHLRQLLKEVWGSKGTRRRIRWPVSISSGTVQPTA